MNSIQAAKTIGIKPITSTYKQWRLAMLIAIRNERRIGFTPKGMGRRIMLAYSIVQRRKYFQLLGQR
jgi:hypothetical protein